MSQSSTRKLIVFCAICGTQMQGDKYWWSFDYNLKTRSILIYPIEITTREISLLGQIDVKTVDVCGMSHLFLAISLIRDGKDTFEYAIR